MDERHRVLEILRRHGWNATSFQGLERGFAYWFDAEEDAVVAYVDTGAAWVVAGAPIAPEHALASVTARFVSAARAARRRVCFFAAESRLLRDGTLAAIPIGEQPHWDPSAWPETLARSSSLREQLRRARAKGVTTREAPASELADPSSPLRRSAARLVHDWLASRRIAPMGFLVDVQIFDLPGERRYFVAERDGALVAMLVAVPVYARDGWLFEDVLRTPDAPNGTIELLVDAGFRAVARDKSRFATLGLAPLAGELPPWLRTAREFSRALYDFDGVRRFRAKLGPAGWSSIHLAWPAGGSPNVALYDALAAFTMRGRDGHERASFVRFGLETLAHAPALSVRVLAVLLVPWTAALAVAPTERFFPSSAVHVAWVVFDVVLACAMFALAARWRSGLARAIAVATSIDAALTLLQALLYAGPRATSALDVAGIVVACAGPLLATSLLWGALAWRHRGARAFAALPSSSPTG